jgi:hypothetical protein
MSSWVQQLVRLQPIATQQNPAARTLLDAMQAVADSRL